MAYIYLVQVLEYDEDGEHNYIGGVFTNLNALKNELALQDLNLDDFSKYYFEDGTLSFASLTRHEPNYKCIDVNAYEPNFLDDITSTD